MRQIASVLALLFLHGLSPSSSVGLAQTSFPKPSGHVNDFAGILDEPTRIALEERLKAVETKTSAEIAVATVASLDGMSVDEYANRLFKQWGVGQEKVDNGVLVVVAPNEREMRIEVGYGLEGILPDGLAGQISDQQFLPKFRTNDYRGGIADGVNRIADIVEKNQVVTAEELARINQSPNRNAPPWVAVPFLGMFVAIGSFMVGLGLRSKAVFPILFGSFFAGMPMTMGFLVMFTATLFILAPFSLAMAAWGYWLGGRDKWKDFFRPGKGGGGSGWVMGGSRRSGSGGSSSGGSFGGGSSGGGGASRSW